MNILNEPKTFRWKGFLSDNTKVEGQIDAFSKNLAKNLLIKRGIQVNCIRIQLWKKSISSQDKILFFRQISILISAGIVINDAMNILTKYNFSPQFRNILHEMSGIIQTGHSLSDSMRQIKNGFENIVIQLIKAGEHTGTLELILKKIVSHEEKKIEIKQKLFSAMLYPAVIFCVASILFLLMILFIIPKFAEIFSTFNRPLPLFTRCVINLSQQIKNYLGYFLILIPLLFYLLKSTKFKINFTLLLPSFLKNIWHTYFLAQFTRHLHIMYTSGIVITEALRVIENTLTSIYYRQCIPKLIEEINKGQQLHFAMHQIRLFPTPMVQMISIGEETGTLDQILLKLAYQFDVEVENYLVYLSKLLEPLIIVILGVLIGVLIIAMYLPIFDLGTIS